MKILSKDLVEEFYLSIKDKYPNITLEQCKEIVYTPFTMTAESIKSDKIETIRLKYFGTFVVYPKRAKSMLKKLEEKYSKDLISESYYKEAKKKIDDYLHKES